MPILKRSIFIEKTKKPKLVKHANYETIISFLSMVSVSVSLGLGIMWHTIPIWVGILLIPTLSLIWFMLLRLKFIYKNDRLWVYFSKRTRYRVHEYENDSYAGHSISDSLYKQSSVSKWVRQNFNGSDLYFDYANDFYFKNKEDEMAFILMYNDEIVRD